MERIVSLSGGKDSTAMLLMLLEKKRKIDKIIFADTTLELPETYLYLNNVEKYIGREIIRVSPKKTFDDWCLSVVKRGKHKGRIRGLPPVLYPCYWMREVKVNSLKEYTKGNIVYIGIASDEKIRAKENKFFIAKYPLVDWNIKEIQCKIYLKERGLLNPLYNYMNRTGCYLCPKQSILNLRYTYNNHKDLWEKMKYYENKSYEFHPGYNLNEMEKRFKIENTQLTLFN